MATITTRSGKGSALTFTEMDNNFTNLNTDKLETAGGTLTGNLTMAAGKTITIGNDYTFPTTDGSANQFLQTDGNGNLSFVTGAGGGIALTDLSVGAEGTAAGDGSLAYNNTTGVFTYTPPVLSGLSGDTDDISEGSTNLYYTDARAQAVSINNLSEDTTPQLGGTLDILNHEIQSSNSNVVISAEAQDKEVHIEITDNGSTNQVAAEFRDYSFTENATDGDSGSAATVYKPALDIPHGLRIGSSASNFSTTGDAGNNNTNDFNQRGIQITNGDDNYWPDLSIVSYGGANPLLNKIGPTASGGLGANFPSASINFKGAAGTISSPAAQASGKTIGILAFTGHDGTQFGGTGSVASATITVSANETFSTSNARGGKVRLDVTPTGGTAADGDTTSDRIAGLQLVGSEFTINPDSKDLDFVVNGDTTADLIKVDAGTDSVSIKDATLTSTSNGDITIAPDGTGSVKLDNNVKVQGGATDGRYLVVDNFDGATPITFGYASPGITIASKGTGSNRDFPGMLLHNSSSSSGAYPSIWIQRNKNDDPGTTGYLADNERLFAFYGAADRASSYYNQVCGIEYRSAEAHSASAQGGKIEFYTMPNGTNTYNGQTKKMTIDENIEADVPFVLKSYTTTERNALTAVAGMLIFNTTDSKAQVYDGTAWANLH